MLKPTLLLAIVLLALLCYHGAESVQACLLYNLSDFCSNRSQTRGACDYSSTGELCYEIRVDSEIARKPHQHGGRTQRNAEMPDIFNYHLGKLLRQRSKKM